MLTARSFYWTLLDGASAMLRDFVRFDNALIERVFQPAADIIAHRASLDRLRIAGFCVDAASVAWALSQAGSLSAAVAHWQPAGASLRLLLLLLGLVALRSLRELFGRVGAGKGVNPLRVAMLPHRGVLLALLVARLPALGGFAAAADLAMLLLTVCALYLGACASRPPVRRRSPWRASALPQSEVEPRGGSTTG